MRNYFLALLLLIFNSCNESLNYNLIDGEVDKDYLFNSKNTKWFPKNYDSYKSDIFLSENNFDNIDNFIIELYMGVTCHDSEREIPRLIKILDEINFPDNQLNCLLYTSPSPQDRG